MSLYFNIICPLLKNIPQEKRETSVKLVLRSPHTPQSSWYSKEKNQSFFVLKLIIIENGRKQYSVWIRFNLHSLACDKRKPGTQFHRKWSNPVAIQTATKKIQSFRIATIHKTLANKCVCQSASKLRANISTI